MLTSREHYELMACFEREYRGMRLDKEEKSRWVHGNLYQDGQVNALFLAYRRGYAFAQGQARE